MLLSAERSYRARTYGSAVASSASASSFSCEPTDTMQMKKPSRGYTVHLSLIHISEPTRH